MLVTRRRLLEAGGVTLAIVLSGGARAAQGRDEADGSAAADRLGHWFEAPGGLPAYRYTGPLPAIAKDLRGLDSMQSPDPHFILGNYRFTVFAHVSGIMQFMTGERVWARTNAGERINYGANAAALVVATGKDERRVELVGLRSIAADPARTQRSFGTGFARYDYRIDATLHCSRVVSSKPSTVLHMGNPAVVIRVTLRNTGNDAVRFDYHETVANAYVPAGQQLIKPAARIAAYTSRVVRDAASNTAISRTRYQAKTFLVEPGPSDNSPIDVRPVGMFLHARAVDPGVVIDVSGSDDAALRAKCSGSVPGRGSVSFDVVIGMTYDGFKQVATQVRDLYDGAGAPTADAGLFLDVWRARLPDLSREKDIVLRRETAWNAYVVECMATYSAYFDETFVPQGMLYTYQDGENISNRDHLQAVLPLCYTNPALAKSCLRYVLQHTTGIGEVKRGTSGIGYSPPNTLRESDAQLYVFMALAEYLRITRDYAFLAETIRYYPVEVGRTGTVLDLLERQFVYLRDEVGIGENGLIRILNSDWSDSFFQHYSPNNTAGFAESHLNSAMALAVIPSLVVGLRKSALPRASALTSALQNYHEPLLAAYLADLGSRNFSARAYLNDKKPKFGVDHVSLEPQGFLLQIPELSSQRKRAIYAKVKAATLLPEKYGFRIREKPVWGSGEGEDGAIWPSLEGQVIRGVASFDKAEARALLRSLSFDSYSKLYPDFWCGRWTAHDHFGSTLSKREGLLGYWVDIRTVFQGFCSHAHAWPLYNYMLIKEG